MVGFAPYVMPIVKSGDVMGMFDYISFEEPLPAFPVEIITWGMHCPQTKSFAVPFLESYIIRDRKLYLREKVIPYHGDLELTCRSATGDSSVYLVIRFTDGELQWIKEDSDELYR